MPATLSSQSLLAHLFPSTSEGASSGAELVTMDGRAIPLVAVRLVAQASGGIARVVLEQRFENPYTETLQVTYRMPLPAEGAVSGYEFEIAERVVKGVVDRKRAARERFEQAIAEGKTAGLLEQERADIFTQQLGNLPAKAAIIARITIDQRLGWLPEGEWELRFPTVIGPRYLGVHDTAADVRATHVKVADQPLAVRVHIAVAIGDALTGLPSSPSHSLRQTGDTVELRDAARLDRDLVIRWPVSAHAVGCTLAAARTKLGAFGLLTIVPPTKPEAAPRDLIVLLDTSGSMGGGPLDKAKQVVALMIASLGEQDQLELIEFSSSPHRYLKHPVAATAEAKRAAIKWVQERQAGGGTEIREATLEALKSLREGAQRQVVVVTDGYVGGEEAILRALHANLPTSCRLHVLGVGAAVNRSLATALARAGRGAEVIVAIDEDAERGAKRLLDRTKQPVLTNVSITGSALVQHAPEHVPDVFEGAPLVAALALHPEGGELIVRGELARARWEQRIVVAPVHGGNPALATLFARERVADLEAHLVLEKVDDKIEQLGIDHQIATRLTSWVAIDEASRVTGPSRDENIPQELPYGTTMAGFGLRSGYAATAPETRSLARTGMMHSVAPQSFAPGGAPRQSRAEGAPKPAAGKVGGSGIGVGVGKREEVVGPRKVSADASEKERAPSADLKQNSEDTLAAPEPQPAPLPVLPRKSRRATTYLALVMLLVALLLILWRLVF